MASEVTKYPVDSLTKKGVAAHLTVTILLLIVLMSFGAIMLLNQANLVKVTPTIFYSVMTVHGAGMVGAASLGGCAVLWYFLCQYVPLNPKILMINLWMSVIGVVLILLGVFGFGFTDAWTFLYPLPAFSSKFYGTTGPMLFFFGLLFIGVGYLIVYLEMGIKISRKYGGLFNGLGWAQIFGKGGDYGPPGAVVAATMNVIANSVGILAGAFVIVASILNIINPNIQIDPLMAKEFTYAFGHIFANCTIYMAVAGVYEILAMYTKRPWKSNKVFLIAWNFSTLFTLMIFTHHLLMDFAVPHWLLIMGQIFSYANGLPVMVVTAYGALMIIYRSGIKWDMPSGLMFLSMFGWVAGAIPAVIDATIVVNHVMHNTKWVPGHFHTYMGLGVIIMIIGFMYYYVKVECGRRENEFDKVSAAIYSVFFLGLTGSFLYAGKIGTPRRWAEHLPNWILSDRVGATCAIIIIMCTIFFATRFIFRLNSQQRNISSGNDLNEKPLMVK
ncbi:MAG TPA: cbb3-type cytochrome c oxidase subunit I [Bacillota bacterium]|nr:cbb3-type cytochrome c oxidase subunit I [Bacillota bacterium]